MEVENENADPAVDDNMDARSDTTYVVGKVYFISPHKSYFL